MTIPPALFDPLAWQVQHVDELSAEAVWVSSPRTVFSARRFRGAPSFYPVYTMAGLYSHSPLGLIARSGELRLDRSVASQLGRGDRRYWSGTSTLDSRIQRVGAPGLSMLSLRDPDTYVQRISEALIADVAAAEGRFSGHTNVVLCGGKDSLNLLLLPWRNPVVALSAAPNFSLVKQFVVDNGLTIDVQELRDDDRSLLPTEIVANLCRLDLGHCRWSAELRAIAVSLGRRVVFWKGQLADTFLTPYWQTYTHPPKLRRLVKLPGIRRLTTSVDWYQSFFWWSAYHRGAMWQGTHMSLLRDLTESTVLSAYHGPSVTSVLSEVDLASAVIEDVRDKVGATLAGGNVRYPGSNPGPPPSKFRRGLSGVSRFLEEASRMGLKVS